jgi:hypothetical protein
MKINYLAGVKPIHPQAAQALSAACDIARVASVIITSGKRAPEDQARIMYDNLEKYGVIAQRKLYKPQGGGLIIDAYASLKAMGQTPELVKAGMVRKINEIGPEKISAHCTADPAKIVFDVAPSSVPEPLKPAFVTAVNACPIVTKFLKPPTDPAYHIEMKVTV